MHIYQLEFKIKYKKEDDCLKVATEPKARSSLNSGDNGILRL